MMWPDLTLIPSCQPVTFPVEISDSSALKSPDWSWRSSVKADFPQESFFQYWPPSLSFKQNFTNGSEMTNERCMQSDKRLGNAVYRIKSTFIWEALLGLGQLPDSWHTSPWLSLSCSTCALQENLPRCLPSWKSRQRRGRPREKTVLPLLPLPSSPLPSGCPPGLPWISDSMTLDPFRASSYFLLKVSFMLQAYLIKHLTWV